MKGGGWRWKDEGYRLLDVGCWIMVTTHFFQPVKRSMTGFREYGVCRLFLTLWELGNWIYNQKDTNILQTNTPYKDDIKEQGKLTKCNSIFWILTNAMSWFEMLYKLIWDVGKYKNWFMYKGAFKYYISAAGGGVSEPNAYVILELHFMVLSGHMLWPLMPNYDKV